jgi:hypothetical protein
MDISDAGTPPRRRRHCCDCQCSYLLAAMRGLSPSAAEGDCLIDGAVLLLPPTSSRDFLTCGLSLIQYNRQRLMPVRFYRVTFFHLFL